MNERVPVRLVSPTAPFWNKFVHESDELVAVPRFQHVDQLVDNDM
jgi:hypothetical protein